MDEKPTKSKISSNEGAVESQWQLPTCADDFTTFIDHGSTLDLQNYPIYPNGRTVYVKTPEMDVTDFGTVGFTKTTNVEMRSNKKWKIVRDHCLGALVCDQPACQWVGSPPTARGGVAKLLES